MSRYLAEWWQEHWSPGWPTCPIPPEGVADYTWWTGCISRGVDVRALKAFAALDMALERWGYAVTSCGCYNCRPIKGTTTPSSHSSRIAVDINPAQNPWAPWVDGRLVTDLPAGLIADIESITAAGQTVWFWGGRWTRYDPMHFQIVATPAELAAGILLPWNLDMAITHRLTVWRIWIEELGKPITGTGTETAAARLTRIADELAAGSRSETQLRNSLQYSGTPADRPIRNLNDPVPLWVLDPGVTA